jgi:hypothetical protein
MAQGFLYFDCPSSGQNGLNCRLYAPYDCYQSTKKPSIPKTKDDIAEEESQYGDGVISQRSFFVMAGSLDNGASASSRENGRICSFRRLNN